MDRHYIENGPIHSRQLFAVLVMLLCLGVGEMWGADTQVYSTGFESTTTDTNYKGTVTCTSDQGNGATWSIYYGNFTTNAPITGSKCAQLRLYNDSKCGTMTQTSDISNVDSVRFAYKCDNSNVRFKVQYSTNSGSTWTDWETGLGGNTSATGYFKKKLATRASKFRLKIIITGGHPSSSSRKLIIDDIVYKTVSDCDDPATALSVSAAATTIYAGVQTQLSTSGGNGSTITYSVTSANSTYATIDGSNKFSATQAGTYTVQASQDEDGGTCGGTATVNITVRYQVKWSVNGNDSYSTGSPTTYIGTHNTKVSTLPTDPTSAMCDNTKVFVGWTTSSYSHATNAPTTLFLTAASSPNVTDNVTYYAVFANRTDFTRVTSTSQLAAGKQIVVVDDQNSKVLTTAPGYATAPTESSSKITPSNNMIWTLEANSTNWKLKTSGSYLGASSTSNGTSVSLTSTNSIWTIGASSSGTNNFYLLNTGGTNLCLEYYSSGSSWVVYANKNYTSSTYFTEKLYVATLTNYATTCCTPLASINGSFSWSNVSPTSVTVGVPSDYSDKDNANLEGYIFKRYTASTGGSAVETKETISSSGTTATFNTSLSANTTYYYTIIAKHSSSSCNSEETSPRKSYTITSYTVSYANGGGSGTNPGAHDPVLSGTSVTLKANTFTAPAGKQFAGWNDGSNDYSAGASYSVTANKTMTAQWSCITPTISVHPSGASYTEGATPTDLSVTASGGTLSYQWKQCDTENGTYANVESGGTSSTYSPSTASAGTTYYKCVVTNTGSSCGTSVTSNAAAVTVSEASQCLAPTFSPAEGTYNSSQTVTISSLTSGSTIYYTTNGDDPTTSDSHGTEGDASASVTVSSSQTLKAIAVRDDMTDSDVSSAAYVICSTDPSFSTTSSSNITITGARITCAGITKGTCNIDAYGIVYGTSANPTGNAQEKGTDASSNVSSYYVDLTGLTAATTYYARPYATVNGKTVYGSEISFTTLNIPVITVSETSRAFGTKKVDGSYTMTFTVSGAYMQDDIELEVTGTNSSMFSVDKTSLSPSIGTVGTTTITVTYTPSAAGSHSASVSITSTNATTKTVTLSGTGRYEDTYMTAMHEGVTDWEDYATGVVKTGSGYTIPNPGDIAAGDREGTGCEGIHYHFAGWVAETYKASPSGHIIPATGTTTADNTTYWAVWEKEKAGSAGAEANTVLWAEDFSAWGDSDVPNGTYSNSHTGTTVYGAGSVTYACVNGGSNTKLYGGNQTLYAGGTKPELLVGKTTTDLVPVTGTFTVSGIPNGGAAEITVSYKQNDKELSVSASGDGYSGSATNTPASATTESFDVTVSSGASGTFTLTFAATSTNNVRLDDISVKVKTQGFVYEDPKVECICSATAVAGTAAVDATGTFSASQIDVKATSASTGHADCSYTDYGFVWSSSVTTPTLVEATGAASTNCTKIQVDDEGEVTSFTGSITGSLSAGNAIYFRSYVKNGKSDGTYQYSDVVTVTPRSVTFNLNGHGSSAPATQLVNNGSKATDPSYSESVTGYIFGGWYKEAGCSNVWTFGTDVVSGENKTLYAKWTPITYSIRFNSNDANYLGTATGSMSDQSFDYDESKDLTANGFSLAGYDFAGWATTPTGDVAHEDEAEVENLSSTNGATVNLYAIWTAKKYNVTLAATNETSSVGSQTVQATYNAAMPLVTTADGTPAVAAPSRTGYTFTGWEYSSTTYYNYNAGTSTLSSAHVWDQPNSTTILTPKWSINSYTLTWNLAGGTVSVEGTGAAEGATGTPSSSVEYNSAITAPTVTKSGYNFAGWDIDLAATMPAVATTYTATWTAKTLTSISLAEASVSVYVGEIKYVNVIFDPTDILSKAFGQVAAPSYCVLNSYDSYNKLKITGGRAGADISVNRTETVSIKYTADETKTASISVTVKPLPTVTFVDLIHNKSDFANSGDGWTAGTGVLSSTVTTGVVSHAKKTPTHTDVSAPVGGNACETGHLHLIGWIRSDYSKVAAYMEGTGDAPTVIELTGAGTGYWFSPNADINVETYNGKTFYAVWAVEE